MSCCRLYLQERRKNSRTDLICSHFKEAIDFSFHYLFVNLYESHESLGFWLKIYLSFFIYPLSLVWFSSVNKVTHSSRDCFKSELLNPKVDWTFGLHNCVPSDTLHLVQFRCQFWLWEARASPVLSHCWKESSRNSVGLCSSGEPKVSDSSCPL